MRTKRKNRKNELKNLKRLKENQRVIKLINEMLKKVVF